MAKQNALRLFLGIAFLLVLALPRVVTAQQQTITIYVHDAHGPVQGAIVHMSGEEDVTTGSDGIATFHPPESIIALYVRVRAAAHKPTIERVSSTNMDIYIAEIPAYRTLTVVVKGRYPTGIQPIHGARVTIAGGFGCETNSEGVCATKHTKPIGDELKITAHMGGFEDQTKTITIGAVGISITSTADNASFLLEREKAGEVPLVIEVLNHDNDKPVSGALVNLESALQSLNHVRR